MILALRLLVPAVVILSVIYLILTMYSRWRCRQRLEGEFDAGGVDGSRDDYIENGMKAYEGSLRRKLLLGVFVIPLVVVGTLIYVMNFM